MARNRIGLQFDGWENMIEKLDKLGGVNSVKKGVDAGLKASKQYITPQIEASMSKLPAGGKYSTGRTKASIDSDMTVNWSGMTGEIKIGFDLKKSGLTSIFLMYGTPRMKPINGLKAAIYGAKTKQQVNELQAEAVNNVIKSIMEG